MKLKLGIIGLPSDWQQRYLPALHVLHDRFDVVGVYSSVSRIGENAARQLETQPFGGFRDLIRRADVDAILVLAADWYGLAPVQAACDHGKAVYCGSEVDFAPDEVHALGASVDEAGIAFMAEFPKRYSPASLRLKELIATRLGPPEMLFCHKRLKKEDRRGDRTLADRLSRELMEQVDWCSYLVGRRPDSVQSVSHTLDGNAPGVDYQALSVHYPPIGDKPAALAQISCGSYIKQSWEEAVSFRPQAAVQVCCRDGLAFIDLPNGLTWFDSAGRHQESLESEIGVGQQLLGQFHRAVTSLLRKMGDLEDVAFNLRTLQAAQRSILDNRSIDL